MRKWMALAVLGLAAATAYGIGMGAGGFGGIALPMGDMASEENGDFGMSPKVGGKVLIGVMPMLDVEVAFGYHLGHKFKDWEDIEGIDEPKLTVIPITFGANYKMMFGNMGAYVGGGGGFYMMSLSSAITIVMPPLPPMTGEFDLTMNKPGIYVGGGFMYYLGNLAIDVSPRFNYVMNDGDYDIDVTVNGVTGTGTIEKDYKDMYVDVLFGVDYFFM